MISNLKSEFKLYCSYQIDRKVNAFFSTQLSDLEVIIFIYLT